MPRSQQPPDTSQVRLWARPARGRWRPERSAKVTAKPATVPPPSYEVLVGDPERRPPLSPPVLEDPSPGRDAMTVCTPAGRGRARSALRVRQAGSARPCSSPRRRQGASGGISDDRAGSAPRPARGPRDPEALGDQCQRRPALGHGGPTCRYPAHRLVAPGVRRRRDPIWRLHESDGRRASCRRGQSAGRRWGVGRLRGRGCCSDVPAPPAWRDPPAPTPPASSPRGPATSWPSWGPRFQLPPPAHLWPRLSPQQ